MTWASDNLLNPRGESTPSAFKAINSRELGSTPRVTLLFVLVHVEKERARGKGKKKLEVLPFYNFSFFLNLTSMYKRGSRVDGI